MDQKSNNNNVPRHVAIIMDGNGRWANADGKPRIEGHRSGVDSVREVVRTAVDLGVEYLTIYAFSTENWGRPADEVDGIMELLAYTISAEVEPLAASGVRLRFIGDLQGLPVRLQEAIGRASAVGDAMAVGGGASGASGASVKLNLVIAVNYSSRWEITQAVRGICCAVERGELSAESVDQEVVSGALSSAFMPDPDLLVRTSGEQRLSNFLLWQLSYTELYFTDVLWPDFDGLEFLKAVAQYGQRDRRFGEVRVDADVVVGTGVVDVV